MSQIMEINAFQTYKLEKNSKYVAEADLLKLYIYTVSWEHYAELFCSAQAMHKLKSTHQSSGVAEQ